MSIKATLWRTSASSYLRTILRLFLGLFTFRMLYRGLSEADFGYWSLLWSVFGYGVLLDFGLGFAAQKRVAELTVSRDWEELSKVLSTIVTFFVAVGALIFVAAWFGAAPLLHSLKLGAGGDQEHRSVLLLFFAGLALGFPLGIFPEILRGLQRISLVNHIASLALLFNFAGIAVALKLHWGLQWILVIALTASIGPDLICAVLACRLLPHARLDARKFEWRTARETMHFSLWAYVITATNIVLGKTDQLVIGTALSVSAVAIYVTGAKVSEIFSLFTRQLQEALSPAAAHFRATGSHEALRELLIEGTRLSTLVATPLFLLCLFYMQPLIRLLTGDAHPTSDAIWTGQVLVVWHYFIVVTHSVSKRIFVMTGHERRLMWLGMGEAVVNLVLSVSLILIFRNVVCVAIGSIIPSMIIGWLILWPWSAREANMTPGQMTARLLLPTWLACVPMALLLVGFQHAPWHSSLGNFWVFAAETSGAMAVAAVSIWSCAMTEAERERIGVLLNLNRWKAIPNARTAR